MARSLLTHAFRALALTTVLALTGTGLTACARPHGHTSDLSSCEVLARYAPKDGTSDSVTIATALTGTEGERFEQSLTRFEECTGIDVVHEGSDKLEENLRGRAAEATDWNADLAVVPQPGLVADLADEGVLSPLSDVVGANVELGWDHAWSAAGTVDGTFYGAPLMASVKSFVWYSPQAFAEAGYEVPATWDELVALTNRIAADHPKGEVAPWCLGMADGGTTGWSMSDWLEESLLTTGGVGAYDAWADHDVALVKTGEERIDGVVEEGEVGRVRIRFLRGPDSDEMDPGAAGCLGVGGECQPARIQALPEQALESGL